ncbi:unnamed protein product [Menidia menidia]|uniref:(Atlantic silverside) hypothetical protein n=1 Tax=Menidia menidia TaxID=238744 RepID=A0A8S4ANM7_9TELE|nr:unnamed protein product [Menidia menidia]
MSNPHIVWLMRKFIGSSDLDRQTFSLYDVFVLALREDRYSIAGQAISVSLLHGDPPPLDELCAPHLVGDSSMIKSFLEDIAGADLYEKVSEYTSFEEQMSAMESLQDYLANVRPLKCIEDRDLLVQDILM